MKQISRIRRLLDIDEVGNMTEGQEADYMAAELNDGFAMEKEYSVTETTYKCPKCGSVIVVQE